MQDRILQVDAKDNVLIALTDLRQGESLPFAGERHTLVTGIPAKHKFATCDLATGADVVMYGVIVGTAVRPIRRGEQITTENVQHKTAEVRPLTGEYRWTAPDVSQWRDRAFPGYARSDGQVGTRNYWLVGALGVCRERQSPLL